MITSLAIVPIETTLPIFDSAFACRAAFEAYGTNTERATCFTGIGAIRGSAAGLTGVAAGGSTADSIGGTAAVVVWEEMLDQRERWSQGDSKFTYWDKARILHLRRYAVFCLTTN